MTEDELDEQSKLLATCYHGLACISEINHDYQNALKNYRKAAIMDPDEQEYVQDVNRVADRLTVIINK